MVEPTTVNIPTPDPSFGLPPKLCRIWYPLPAVSYLKRVLGIVTKLRLDIENELNEMVSP